MALHVELVGEGEPLVVLPSFGLDHRAMILAVDHAFSQAQGWARLYVDLPGTGSSSASDPRSDAVLDALAAAISDHLGDGRFAVAGWSYGAYLAAGLARRMPDRILGLMMVCAGFKIDPADRNIAGVADSAPKDGWLEGVAVEWHDYLRHAVGHQSAAAARRVIAVLEANGPSDVGYLGALRAEGFALSDEGSPTRLDAPALLLAGRRDRIAGYADLFAGLEGLTLADYALVANAGHYLPVEVPDRFAVLARDWLRRCHTSIP